MSIKSFTTSGVKDNQARYGNVSAKFRAGLVPIKYVVIAGGGGGGTVVYRGGGGAGGYRSSMPGELSGGSSAAEPLYDIEIGKSYTVSVGAGGGPAVWGYLGGISFFGDIMSVGGGGGASGEFFAGPGGIGGSAGGTSFSAAISQGIPGQGSAGGPGGYKDVGYGGGAGGAGTTSVGGVGISSSITGSPVTRANALTGGNGAANTGQGAGSGGTGGSGIVIIRFPALYSISIGPGLAHSISTVGDEKVVQFTSGQDTVVFS